jgi:sulfatase maturation enzyme AslB (radical SAM superfamily)
MLLEITTNLPCTNRCHYCPQGILRDEYEKNANPEKMLSLENFKILLRNVAIDTDISFSGFSEPFLNPDCVDMIKHAYSVGHMISLYTTLVGLDDEQAEELNDINFVKVSVHDIGLPERDYLWIDNFLPVIEIVPRAGNLFDTDKRRVSRCTISKDFSMNVLLPNGDVVLCCQDYLLEHRIGNLYKTPLNEMVRFDRYKLCEYCEYAF